MEYSIYKDSTTKTTIERIKKIQNQLGIKIEEIIHHYPINDKKQPFSLGLHLFDSIHLSNGKGTTLENARASAYSEFLERLQNNHKSPITYGYKDFVFAPDEKFIDFNPNKDFFQKYYDKEIVNYIRKISEKYPNNENYFTVPFYSVKEKKVCDIPITILLSLQGTNGMSAGNTPEEALVQGLSEIFERYATKKVLKENISMPDIPEEVWGKYERIKELKEYIEQYGYEIRIKDASLGKNLPVVCTTFENKEEGFFSFNFGAQPSLPVAIERTFTEFAQGGIPNYETNKISLPNYNIKFIDRDYLFEIFKKELIMIKTKQDKSLYKQFFINSPDFEFSKSSWINEEKSYTNNELLKFLLTNIILIQDKDIYIRDVSYLNFPSYYIYIPYVSEIGIIDKQRLQNTYNLFAWNLYTKDICSENTDINSLISALEFRINYLDFSTKGIKISPLPEEYLLMLCYLIKKDEKKIIKYSKEVLKKDNNVNHKQRCQFIYDYYSYKNLYNKEDMREQLEKKYDKKYINNFEKFINEFSFNDLKNIISINNKEFLDQQKNRVTQQKTSDNDLKIKALKNKINDLYLKNIPNQMDLSQIFDFIK